ncbi:MAG: hypothetical protein H7246_20155 [Phycisphaerae bacterium]|nr:hypothetical protein [Saprospiraceae bacterium]
MYAEKQLFQNRYTRWLKWASSALAFSQLAALLGAETGLPWLPLGYAAHLLLLMVAGIGLMLVHSVGLSLRVSSQGWALRRTPLHFSYRHIGWAEIRNVRILKPCALPSAWRQGNVEHSIGQHFLISNPQYDVACIEMTSGFQVFVSVQKPNELMEFLHHGLLRPDLLVPRPPNSL